MNHSKLRAWHACVVLYLCGWPDGAGAADQRSLTLRDALSLAAERNPDIAAFQPQAEASRQQAALHSLRPVTTVDVQFENFAGTGSLSAARSLETTLQLSHIVELGGKAPLRRRVGEAALEQLDAAQTAKRADILAEVARRFIHVLSDQEQLKSTERATELAAQARDVVQERIEAGASSPVSLNRAEIVLARSRLTQEHAEHELLSSRVALAALWGDDSAQFGEVRGELFEFPVIEPLEAYAQRLVASPELLKFATDARALDARTQLARAQQTPNVTLSAGVRRLEGLDDQAFVAGFAVPLGMRKRMQPELLAIQAEREHLRLSEQSRLLELKVALFDLYQETLHARTAASTLGKDIRPQAERLLRTSEAGYRVGRFSLQELAEARQQLLDIEQESIRAAAEFHTHLVEIERLTGAAVHTLQSR